MDEYSMTDVSKENRTATVSTMIPIEWRHPLPANYVIERRDPVHLVNLTALDYSIEILNIPFIVRREKESVIVENPRWVSLRTHGGTMRDAVNEMLELIQEMVKEYVLASENELTQDAIEFRRYLIQKMFA
jgi:hypothetical protein